MAGFSFAQIAFVAAMCLAVLASTSSAFVISAPGARSTALAHQRTAPSSALRRCRRSVSTLCMSEEDVVEEAAAPETPAVAEQQVDPAADATSSVRSFFAPNENVRLGSSRDQDGKSNVWAVEPKMRVEGTDVESPEGGKLAVTGALLGVLVVAMAATIAFLPNADSL